MDWICNAVFYHLYPLGFCGAPRENDGGQPVPRLDKLLTWIPHLKELGVNAVYLGPTFESDSHGYDTRDYYAIDRRLGTNASFAHICETLHENGIRVMLDGVFNHVGRGFWAFEDVRKNGERSQYKDWFTGLHFGGSSPYGDAFSYEGWHGHMSLVKLNLQNPDVVQHLLDAVGHWMSDYDIDGLRLDAADCVDDNFFRQLRHYCKSRRPDFWLMGEIIHGDYNRWANPQMLDSVTNYECRKGLYSSHNDHNYFEIAHSINRQSGNGGIYEKLALYTFVDNHDVDRLASVLREPRLLPLIYTLLFTMPGIPSIYYGSEWGVAGARDKYSDDVLRPCLTLGEIPNANEALCRHIAFLSRLRQALPALQYGRYESALVKNEQYVFLREAEGQRVYIALNLAEHSEYVQFHVHGAPVIDLLTGTSFETNDGNLKLELPACGARVFVTPALYARLGGQPWTVAAAGAAEVSAPADAEVAPAGLAAEVVCVQTAEVACQTPATGERWRHFKGKDYEIVGLALHSETQEQLVVYRALYGDGGLWVRPLAMFIETIERDGKRFPRFAKQA